MKADVRELLAEARAELGHADQKAATLLAALMVVVSVVSAALLAGQWSPESLSSRSSLAWWCAAALTAVAIACLGAAVWPRTGPRRPPTGATYFGDIAQFGDASALDTALKKQDADERVISQLLIVSKVVTRKYAYIRAGMVAAGAAAAIGGTTGLVIA